MLQQMRENFTGTFALVILGMIGVSFIFFGLNYSFIGSSFAAKVDGQEISPVVFESNYRDAIQRNPQLASVSGDIRIQVRRNILDQMIGEQLIENFLNENGYRISDEQLMRQVQSTPEFQLDGKFDMPTYRAFLAERGMEPTRFETLQRGTLRQQQLQLALAATSLVTPSEYRRYINLVAEQRVATIASIDESAVAEQLDVSDEMIVAYYTDNPDLYLTPESADVEFIEIRRDSVAENIEISEADLLAHYENSQDRYLQDEQRSARHILVLFNDDEDAAEAKANEILARIQAGEVFEDLASELSDDGGTASQGGNLGTLTRTQLPGELGSSIFATAAGDIDGPVKSEFGFHIVRVDEVLERGPLPLDQVRGELLSELRAREADDLYRDLERSLSDALFDNSDMEAISAAVGIDIQRVEGFTRAGGGDFGTNQVAIDAIFDELVLTGGQISEVVELDASRSAIFKVAAYKPASRRSLDEVRAEVREALMSQQAEDILIARAEQMLAAIDGGEDFGVAAEAAGFTVTSPQILSRNDQTIDQSLLFEIFAAAKPKADAPVVGRVRALDGAYQVYSLDAVLPGRPESIAVAERDERKLMLAQQSGIGDFQAFLKTLYDDADIEVNDDVVAADDLLQ
jgi:peptidyl-prolyl cis-trans isomerase D